MARIPGEEIERLKQTVSVERLVEGRGVKLVRHGADLLGPSTFVYHTIMTFVYSQQPALPRRH